MISGTDCVKVEKNVSAEKYAFFESVTHMVDLEQLFTEFNMERLRASYIKL